MTEDDQSVINDLEHIGLMQISKVSIYNCYRIDRDDQEREIEIRVYDSGSSIGAHRYLITAETIDDGEKKIATGNGGVTIDEALMTLHWSDLN